LKENNNVQWIEDLRRERLKGSSRNPGAAALMSFFVMGLGQIYAGHIDRGIMLMGIYFGGLFSALSIYNGGMVYSAVVPYLGAHLAVVAIYIFSVVFILLWIYNIKDAYYLSLFSSFRDWFEVEQVLLPMLASQPENLLTAPKAKSAGLLVHDDSAVDEQPAVTNASERAAVADEHEDADIVEIQAVKKSDDEEEPEAGQVVYAADFGAMKMHGQSWKLYFGLVLIFLLVGLWLEKRDVGIIPSTVKEQTTLFAVAGEIKNVGEATSVSSPESVAKIESLPAQTAQTELATVLPADTAPSAGSETTLLPAEIRTVQVPDVAPEPEPIEPFAAGFEMVKNGNYAEAAVLFEKALSNHEPEKSEWRIILNSFYRADALIAYETGLRRYLNSFPDEAAAWFNLGKLLYDRNELAEAAQTIVKGLRHDPENFRGNYLLGLIYVDLKLFAESITYLERATAMEPLNVDLNRQLARALKAEGRSEDAARHYQRILSLVPDDNEALQSVATARKTPPVEEKVLVVQGRTEARLIEKKAIETPEIPVSGKVLFEAPASDKLTDRGSDAAKPDEPDAVRAATVDRSASEADVIIPVVEESAATANAKESANPVSAVSAVAAAAVVKPVVQPSPTAAKKTEIAAPKQPAKKTDPVVEQKNGAGLRDAVAREPDKKALNRRIEEFRKKGAFEFSKGNWEGALPNYLEVLKLKKDSQTYDMVGVIFEKLSMHKDAFDAVERAYRLGRKDAVTLTRLGRLAETTGNYVKGEAYLYQALQKSPHRVDLRIRYAKCLEANGHPEKAIAEYEKIARAGGDSYALKRRAELEINRIRSSEK